MLNQKYIILFSILGFILYAKIATLLPNKRNYEIFHPSCNICAKGPKVIV